MSAVERDAPDECPTHPDQSHGVCGCARVERWREPTSYDPAHDHEWCEAPDTCAFCTHPHRDALVWLRPGQIPGRSPLSRTVSEVSDGSGLSVTSDVSDVSDDGGPKRRFAVVSMHEVEARPTTFLVPDLIPDDDLTVLVGEEGIGKGLWSCSIIATVTKQGHHVLMVAGEDDPERTLRARLDAAGADVEKVHLMVLDADSLLGQPTFPHDLPEVEQVVAEYQIRLVVIDPWVSTVSGGLRLRDTQDARRALDPLSRMARRNHTSVLAVAHPNRGDGSLRDRVGLTAVLRQAARVLIYALEDPDDDTVLYVGVEKANGAARAPASVYRKVEQLHANAGSAFHVVEESATDWESLTIREWDARFSQTKDRRVTDRWTTIERLASRSQGLVTRADIVNVYESTGSTADAADRQIRRWLVRGGLVATTVDGTFSIGRAR